MKYTSESLEVEKSSIGIILISGIVIIATIAGVCGKSCGCSAANQNVTHHSTPTPPSRNELKGYNIAGINLLLPKMPVADIINLPKEASQILSSFKSYKVTDCFLDITITQAIYVNPEVNLDGSADGSIEGVRNLPSVSLFTSSKKTVDVAGLSGRSITMIYRNSKFEIDQYSLVFASGNKYWQVQIIGKDIQNKTELEDLKNVIFKSIRLSQINK